MPPRGQTAEQFLETRGISFQTDVLPLDELLKINRQSGLLAKYLLNFDHILTRDDHRGLGYPYGGGSPALIRDPNRREHHDQQAKDAYHKNFRIADCEAKVVLAYAISNAAHAIRSEEENRWTNVIVHYLFGALHKGALALEQLNQHRTIKDAIRKIRTDCDRPWTLSGEILKSYAQSLPGNQRWTDSKPDLCLSFHAYSHERSDGGPMHEDSYISNFGRDSLAKLYAKDDSRKDRFKPYSSPFRRFYRDDREYCDQAPFPFAICEWKKHSEKPDYPPMKELKIQIAKGGAIAATIFANLSAGWHGTPILDNIRPVVCFSFLGKSIHVYLMFIEGITPDNRYKYQIRRIWYGDMTDVVKNVELCWIIERLYDWAIHHLRPWLSSCIDAWNSHPCSGMCGSRSSQSHDSELRDMGIESLTLGTLSVQQGEVGPQEREFETPHHSSRAVSRSSSSQHTGNAPTESRSDAWNDTTLMESSFVQQSNKQIPEHESEAIYGTESTSTPSSSTQQTENESEDDEEIERNGTRPRTSLESSTRSIEDESEQHDSGKTNGTGSTGSYPSSAQWSADSLVEYRSVDYDSEDGEYRESDYWESSSDDDEEFKCYKLYRGELETLVTRALEMGALKRAPRRRARRESGREESGKIAEEELEEDELEDEQTESEQEDSEQERSVQESEESEQEESVQEDPEHHEMEDDPHFRPKNLSRRDTAGRIVTEMIGRSVTFLKKTRARTKVGSITESQQSDEFVAPQLQRRGTAESVVAAYKKSQAKLKGGKDKIKGRLVEPLKKVRKSMKSRRIVEQESE